MVLQCAKKETVTGTPPPPIELRATVRPAQSMTVTAQIDGQVQTVAVVEGAAVQEGTELVLLVNPAVEREAALAKAQSAGVQARLRGSSAASAQPGAIRPRGNEEIASRILALRQQQFEKMKQLRKSNDITARELQQAEVEYLAALRDYNNERNAGAAPAARGNRAAELELLRAEQARATAEERFAGQRESLLHIASPIRGTVTRLHVKSGQNVFPRDPIADVSDIATLHVTGEIAPELLQFVKAGTSVNVRVLSVPPRTFSDEIEYVSPVAGSGPEARSAAVTVVIPNPDGSLQPNTPAVITVRSAQ